MYFSLAKYRGTIIGGIIVFLINLLLVNIINVINLFFKKSFNYTYSKIKQINSNHKKWKNKREYYKTIRLIEKKKIDIPKNFFMGKSKKRNPELKMIYDMIENGELERPDLFLTDEELEKIQKAFKNNIDKQAHVPPLSTDIPRINPRDFNNKN